MLRELTYVNLPDHFVGFLCQNFQDQKRDNQYLNSYCHKHPELMGLILRTMSEFDEENRVEGIIRNVGWRGLRDRLASSYLHKEEFGKYPSEDNLDNIVDLEALEEVFETVSVDSYSRSFMLAFYFKLLELKDKKDGKATEKIKIPQSVVEIIQSKSHKNMRIDWLILIVWHFIEYFGRSKLEELMTKYHNEYENIYLSMNEESRLKMTRNLLNYGLSIGDTDTILFERV